MLLLLPYFIYIKRFNSSFKLRLEFCCCAMSTVSLDYQAFGSCRFWNAARQAY
jgi:hypothetical protein